MKNSKYVSPREWAARQYRAGRASKHIASFDVKPGDKVWLAARKSNCDRRPNLLNNAANLRAIVEAAGGIVLGVSEKTISGWDTSWLGEAAGMAKRAGAIALIAECTDRFVRNKHYHSVELWTLQATEEELGELAWCANGMRLIDALPET
jgi:hypothetical protein